MSTPSKDATVPNVITDLDESSPVPESIRRMVAEGEAAGIRPERLQ